MRMNDTEQWVRSLLKNYPETRGSDLSLIAAWLYIKEERPDLSKAILEIKHKGLCNFETIRRTRQKIQATTPSLRAPEEIQMLLDIAEENYRQYSLEDMK